MSTVSIVAILGLFAFLVYRGMRNNSGSVCGRGWLAFLMLPIAAAVTYTLFLKTLYRDPTAPAPRKSVAKAPVKKAPLKSVAGQKGKAPSVVSAVKNAPANIKQTVTGAKQAVSTAKSVLNTAKSVKGLQGLAKSYVSSADIGMYNIDISFFSNKDTKGGCWWCIGRKCGKNKVFGWICTLFGFDPIFDFGGGDYGTETHSI